MSEDVSTGVPASALNPSSDVELIRHHTIGWHRQNGGHPGAPEAHALRLLHEVVELCYASGCEDFDVIEAFTEEAAKATNRGENKGMVTLAKIEEEVADVEILFTIFCANLAIDREKVVVAKQGILRQRRWQADEEGVLWRKK